LNAKHNAAQISSWNLFVRGFRVATTRAAALLACAAAMVTEHNWPENGWVDTMMEICGFVLVLICTLGRIWCSLYIAGRKQKELVTEGPYSLTRNPLYFFSLIGAVGVACGTETITFPLLVALAFALYYPHVIRNEEDKMRALFGEQYTLYAARVPVFFPNFRAVLRLEEPDSYLVRPRLVRKELLRVGWFIAVFLIVHSFEWLHEIGVLPVMFHLR